MTREYPRIIWAHVREHAAEYIAEAKNHGHCPNCTYSFLEDGRIKIIVHNSRETK